MRAWQEIVEKTLHQLGKDVLVDSQAKNVLVICVESAMDHWRSTRNSKPPWCQTWRRLSMLGNQLLHGNGQELMEASDDEIHGERAKQPRLDPSVSGPPSRVRKQLVYPSASLPKSSGFQSPAVTVCLLNVYYTV